MFLFRYVKGVPFFIQRYIKGKPFLTNVTQVRPRDGAARCNILYSTAPPPRGGGWGQANNNNTFVIKSLGVFSTAVNLGHNKKE